MAKKEKKINIDDIPGDNIRRLDKLKDLLTPYNGDPTENLHPAFKEDITEDNESIIILDDDNTNITERLNDIDLNEKQLAFIKCYHKFNYHIGKTCEHVGIHRQTYYAWLQLNPNFKMATEYLHEAYIDDAVACVNRAIGNDNVDAAKFVLKTLGKRRGFVESMDITSNGETIGVPTINIIMPKIDE